MGCGLSPTPRSNGSCPSGAERSEAASVNSKILPIGNCCVEISILLMHND